MENATVQRQAGRWFWLPIKIQAPVETTKAVVATNADREVVGEAINNLEFGLTVANIHMHFIRKKQLSLPFCTIDGSDNRPDRYGSGHPDCPLLLHS